eukprot:sb/3476573/
MSYEGIRCRSYSYQSCLDIFQLYQLGREKNSVYHLGADLLGNLNNPWYFEPPPELVELTDIRVLSHAIYAHIWCFTSTLCPNIVFYQPLYAHIWCFTSHVMPNYSVLPATYIYGSC